MRTAAAPGTAREVHRLLKDLEPTLPILLSDLTSVGQVIMPVSGSTSKSSGPMIRTPSPGWAGGVSSGLALR